MAGPRWRGAGLSSPDLRLSQPQAPAGLRPSAARRPALRLGSQKAGSGRLRFLLTPAARRLAAGELAAGRYALTGMPKTASQDAGTRSPTRDIASPDSKPQPSRHVTIDEAAQAHS